MQIEGDDREDVNQPQTEGEDESQDGGEGSDENGPQTETESDTNTND